MREATAAAGTIVIQSQTTLAVQAETVPPSVPAVLKRPTDRAVAAALGTPSVPTVQVAGPYYAHGLTAEDARLVFQTLPAATQDAHRTQVPGAVTPAMQTEMVRRILALENGTGRDIRRFNIRRCVDLFGAGPTDTGATHVQVAVLSAKIFSKKRHLAQYPGDVYAKQALEVAQSRRLRLLRYLRRTDLPLYVKTCYQVGINPDRVRISPQ
ncbi:S15/NS1 RNA-binding domain-containing protein [Caulochytrium protostelioides]|nr:S15/NS1 RNA-binding domain-containing protein [Caulochytrium protostelioides]